jgi:hypothetical protein
MVPAGPAFSDLEPRMTCTSLQEPMQEASFHFIQHP